MLWLLAWLRANDPDVPPPRQNLLRCAALLAYAASLLTYPLALFAPVALLGWQVLSLPNPLRDYRKSLRAYAPMLAVMLAVLALASYVRATAGQIYRPVTIEEWGVLPRIMQAFYVWAYYMWKPWAPYDLAASYSTLHAFNPLDGIFVASAGIVLIITLTLLCLWRRVPIALALWLGHLALLIPVLGLTEYPHSVYDRYSYIHGALWSVTIALLLQFLWSRGRYGPLAGIVVAVLSLLFGSIASQRVPVWSNTITLYRDMVAHLGEHPCRARFDEVLGVHYLRAQMTNEAIVSLENAIRYEARRTDHDLYEERVLPRSHIRLGDILMSQGRDMEGMAHYRDALSADPKSVETMTKLGTALVRNRRGPEAITLFEQALRLRPNNGAIHHEFGLALQRMGRTNEARHHFDLENAAPR